MGRACILGSVMFFILSILFLALSLHLFSLSISIVARYRAVSYINITNFLIDSYSSLAYLLLAVFMLLISGVLLYGSVAASCRCINS
jgi:TctA family transporter